jgi:hypothetical protein
VSGADAAVLEETVGADTNAARKPDLTLEHAVDVDGDIRLGMEDTAQIEPRRIRQGHAGAHKVFGGMALIVALEGRELNPIVDPGDLREPSGSCGCDRHALGRGERGHVGEIVFALDIVVADPGEPAVETRSVGNQRCLC